MGKLKTAADLVRSLSKAGVPDDALPGVIETLDDLMESEKARIMADPANAAAVPAPSWTTPPATQREYKSDAEAAAEYEAAAEARESRKAERAAQWQQAKADVIAARKLV